MRKSILLLLLFLGSGILLVISSDIFATTAEDEDHGGTIVYTKPVKAVIFSHKAHSEDIGLNCEWCHDETFEMEALAVQSESDFAMNNQCNDQYCGVCHNGDISFSITTQCARCHIGVTGYNRLVAEGKIVPEDDDSSESITDSGTGYSVSKFKMPDSERENEHKSLQHMIDEEYFPEDIQLFNDKKDNVAIFSHETHLQRDGMLKCTQCHPKIFVMKKHDSTLRTGHLTMAQMEKGEYCGSCHDGTKAFSITDKKSCWKCHQ